MKCSTFENWPRGTTAALALVLTLAISPGVAEEPAKLDVNDVTFLWPAPKNDVDVSKLIGADEKLAVVEETVFPASVFEKLIQTAASVQMTGSGGSVHRITLDDSFKNAATWKVAGVRIDASAPGSHSAVIGLFGSKPQIRLIFQPVTTASEKVTVHDFAVHLVFDFASPDSEPPVMEGLPPRSVPDRERFRSIVNDLLELKKKLAAAGIQTNTPLNVHPGFANQNEEFEAGIKAFLKKHLSAARVNSVAFMGVQRPEPWIFFAMAKRNGEFQRVDPPTASGQLAQMFTRRGGDVVVPTPKNRTFRTTGVSTAALLTSDAASHLDEPAMPDATDPLLRDIKRREIVDIIANPERSHFFVTDCVSCHTESSVRPQLSLTGTTGRFAYKRPEGISGLADAVLPQDDWNVHNIGWFPDFATQTVAETITHRTANEAAESVEFINREYLTSRTQARPESVANPLTLVMKVKSPEAATELKKLLKQLEALPPDSNPLDLALNKLGNVHYARFVFVTDEHFAVITTYDGDFDRYVDSFVDEIGPVFDKILVHIADSPPLPVSDNREAFANFIRERDRKSFTPFFSAYPKLKTQDVLTLQKRTQTPAQ